MPQVRARASRLQRCRITASLWSCRPPPSQSSLARPPSPLPTALNATKRLKGHFGSDSKGHARLLPALSWWRNGSPFRPPGAGPPCSWLHDTLGTSRRAAQGPVGGCGAAVREALRKSSNLRRPSTQASTSMRQAARPRSSEPRRAAPAPSPAPCGRRHASGVLVFFLGRGGPKRQLSLQSVLSTCAPTWWCSSHASRWSPACL